MRARMVVTVATMAGLLAAPVALRSGGGGARAATASTIFDGCAAAPTPTKPMTVVVGQVACQYLTTHLLGDGIGAPFEYFVPPDCDPKFGVKCPTLYLLHGFGGDYTEMLGPQGTSPTSDTLSSGWIAAETSTPPAAAASQPWVYAHPSTWSPASALDMILVAPLGQTLKGGYGPDPAGQDSYWADWNPKYALNGSSQRYTTPPPRFESFLIDELAPFVEANLPAGSGRDYRAIAGVSLGGYGAYKNGLQHPDEWTTMMSVSGAHNFLFGPAPQPAGVTSPVGVSSPIPIAYTPLPAPTGAVPVGALPSQVGTFLTALDALGDPAADQAYFRGNMPPDLAMNARAYTATSTQAFGIDGFWNNIVQTQPADAGGIPFEVLVTPMNVDMEEAFAAQGVANTWAIHQGDHSDVYRTAWFRGLEQFAYDRLQHAGRSAGPLLPPPPATFDYRSIKTDFTIWGWHFKVDRQPVEFLTLRGVSCASLTLQGSGTVTVTPPPSCGFLGTPPVVNLGNPGPIDEEAGAGTTPVYGQTRSISF